MEESTASGAVSAASATRKCTSCAECEPQGAGVNGGRIEANGSSSSGETVTGTETSARPVTSETSVGASLAIVAPHPHPCPPRSSSVYV